MTLKDFKEKNGYSWRGLAEFLQVNFASLFRYVNEDRLPSLRTAKHIKEKTRGAIDYDDWFKR